MSESITPLTLVKVLDSRLDAGQMKAYAVTQGASSCTYRQFPSSNLSSSSFTFNAVNPPSAQTYVDRTVFLQTSFQVNFTGTSPVGQTLLSQWGYELAPRCMPVNNCLKSLVVTINGSQFTQDSQDLQTLYTRVQFDKLKNFLSESCSTVDNCQLYSEGVGATVNVLASAQNVPPGYPAPRGGFNGIQVLTNTSTSASIILTFTEPLVCSPLVYDDVHGQKAAFYNISTFQVQGNWDVDLASRLLSVSDTTSATFTTITATPLAASLFFGYYSPMLSQPQPSIVQYDWNSTQRYIQAGLALAPGASTQLSMNNIQLSSVPKRMYVFVKPTTSSYNIRQTDTLCRINSISIQFGNRASLLANCNANQLFQISKHNGVDSSWQDWYGDTSTAPRKFSGCGSVLCINPATDLGLSEFQTAGTSSMIQLQIQLNYTSLMPAGGPTLAYDVYLVTVDAGLVTIPGPNSCLQQTSVLGPNDLLSASMMPTTLTTAMVRDASGGNWWSDVTDWYDRNKSWINPVAKGVSTAVKAVFPESIPVLSAVGLGRSGGGLVGGQRVSKKRLLSLMQ